jgi:hypothetical protein
MSEQIHFDASERIRRRLSKPSFLTAHTLAFGVIVVLACWSNLITYYMVDNVTSWSAGVWALLLLAHAAFAYRRSGASKNHRDQVIQEELLRYDDDISTDELVEAHERLSDEVRERVKPLYWTLAVVVAFTALWQLMPIGALLLDSWFGGYVEARYSTVLSKYIPLVGTIFLTIGLAGVQFLLHRTDDNELRTAYLRALYTTKAEKRKRLATERLTIDDEGEIVLEKIEKQGIRSKGI